MAAFRQNERQEIHITAGTLFSAAGIILCSFMGLGLPRDQGQ